MEDEYEVESAVWAALENPVEVGLASPTPGEVVLTFKPEGGSMSGVFMSRKEALMFGIACWAAAFRWR